MAKTKKAVKKAAKPVKKSAGRTPKPVPQPLRAIYQNRFIHIQHKDGSQRKIAPIDLHHALHTQFIHNQIHVDEQTGDLVVPYTGDQLRFTAKQLANGMGRPATESEEFAFKFIKVSKIMRNFGPWLAKQLKRRDMVYADLGEKIGLTPSAVGQLIIRKAEPKIRTVLTILNALEIPLEHL